MPDAATEAIRAALRDGLPDASPPVAGIEHVADSARLLGVYPHVRVQHGGWRLDGTGYRRRWYIWCRYAYPDDPTDTAYAFEERIIRILHEGGYARPDGDGVELRLYRADRPEGQPQQRGGGFRYLATRLAFTEL